MRSVFSMAALTLQSSLFFVFLAFFVLRFSLLFCAFLLSFPRISRVLQGGKSSLFFGGSSLFLPRKQGCEGQGGSFGSGRRAGSHNSSSFPLEIRSAPGRAGLCRQQPAAGTLGPLECQHHLLLSSTRSFPVLFKFGVNSTHAFFRKILGSVKFLSAILGPEMGASILWTPGKKRSFCRKNHVHKIPRFRGGGGSADFIFMGARIFLIFLMPQIP